MSWTMTDNHLMRTSDIYEGKTMIELQEKVQTG
jgi:hypothetical protein